MTLTASSQYYYSSRHATRGADTAEIYISCPWYWDHSTAITWHGIFHSFDNGKTLSVQRKTNDVVERGNIFGDSLPGALIQAPFLSADSLAVSYDYGIHFQGKYFHLAPLTVGGCVSGETYTNSIGGIYRGTGYGSNFTLQFPNDSIQVQEVGNVPGELYGYKQISTTARPIGLGISHDFGQSFNVSALTIPGNPVFDECDLTRGTLPGELYLVVWYDRFHSGLYHSFDYGQTITFQSEMDLTLDELFFTAGKSPGTFYYVRREIVETHSWLWIYFSRDYGVTFTTYFHDLNSVYTGVSPKEDFSELRVYPNPAKNKIFIESSKHNENEVSVTILTITGDQMIKLRFRNQSQMEMDITKLLSGVYLVKIQTREGTEVKKLVVE
jgi:hypothetical protein